MNRDALIAAAAEAREHAHAPFSGFKVGAALEDTNGRIFTGCNIENSSFGLSMCAERVAIFKCVSEGGAGVRSVVVVTAASVITSPCGACRQLLWEFCRDAQVLLVNLAGAQEVTSVAELLPNAFDADSFRPPR